MHFVYYIVLKTVGALYSCKELLPVRRLVPVLSLHLSPHFSPCFGPCLCLVMLGDSDRVTTCFPTCVPTFLPVGR